MQTDHGRQMYANAKALEALAERTLIPPDETPALTAKMVDHLDSARDLCLRIAGVNTTLYPLARMTYDEAFARTTALVESRRKDQTR